MRMFVTTGKTRSIVLIFVTSLESGPTIFLVPITLDQTSTIRLISPPNVSIVTEHIVSHNITLCDQIINLTRIRWFGICVDDGRDFFSWGNAPNDKMMQKSQENEKGKQGNKKFLYNVHGLMYPLSMRY